MALRSLSPCLAGPRKSDRGIIWVPVVLPDVRQINGGAQGLEGEGIWNYSSGHAECSDEGWKAEPGGVGLGHLRDLSRDE